MKHSPLQLQRYLIPEVSCSANPDFDPDKPFPASVEKFEVNAALKRLESPEGAKAHAWSVEMTISQELEKGQNLPYEFSLTLVGLFRCQDGIPAGAGEDRFARVNGSSILYGAAREILRSLTTLGPWGEIMLPTVSFYEGKKKEEGERTSIADKPK